MNSQIFDKARRLYREVEKSKTHWERYDDDPTEIVNIMIDKDAEVRSELVELITAIFEDIADPNRSDSFNELDEKRIKAAKDIISGKPTLFYKSDWEEIVGTQVHETFEIEEAAIERDRQETIALLHAKEVRDSIEDMLRDQADLEEMRKDPHGYHGVSEKNIAGV